MGLSGDWSVGLFLSELREWGGITPQKRGKYAYNHFSGLYSFESPLAGDLRSSSEPVEQLANYF